MGRVLLICMCLFLSDMKSGAALCCRRKDTAILFAGAAPLFLTFDFPVKVLLLPVFDTTPPGLGGKTEPRLAPRSGNLTPPRISPSCPHCVISKMRLWLGRGTIVGERGHCETACQCCFWMDGNRWAPYLAVFYSRKKIHCNSLLLQVVLAHPPHRLSFTQGSSADVIQLPDIRFSR